MREIGGRNERVAVSSEGWRFGLGVCGSIRETDSTTGFGGGGAGAAATGFGAAVVFFAVIGAKAERVATGFGGGALGGGGAGAAFTVFSGAGGAIGGDSTTSALGLLFAVLLGLAVLAGAFARADDFAGAAVLLALRAAGAFRAAVLVVVFVGI